MTDRELLELAAKAAGMDIGFDLPRATGKVPLNWDTGEPWNPLTDDTDALRLAVGLRIDVLHTNIHSAQVHAFGNNNGQVVEDSGADPYAATRRAIVRAAAEIGRAMT